jgi:tRNA1Val (adenine37-N6)-methyltransferase
MILGEIKNNKNSFQFKQFTVEQAKTAMKVGTDGVLLGAWTDFSQAEKVLDIGTGTGLIALMAAQQCEAEITAVEIEKSAAEQAKRNFENSLWKKRLTIINLSLSDFVQQNNYKYDVIVCNPPFFTNSLKNPNAERSLARHNDSMPFDELLKYSSELLAVKSRLSLILPAEIEFEFLKTAKKNGLFPNKITGVSSNPQMPVKRILIEFSKEKISPKKNYISIETCERHSYSDEYINLTREFYLKM